MSPDEEPLPLGPIAGRRGTDGTVTVRVLSGRADRWIALDAVWIGEAAGRLGESPVRVSVESCRAYRDRLVLKLQGVDDAGAATALRGRWVFAPAEGVPALPEGEYWVARLIGLRVESGTGEPLGRVNDVVETGGTDLLEVVDDRGRRHLVPLARSIVVGIDASAGWIRITPPDGLWDLDR